MDIRQCFFLKALCAPAARFGVIAPLAVEPARNEKLKIARSLSFMLGYAIPRVSG